MNAYNIVTNYKINQLIRFSSKYYKVDLGYSITAESNSSDRVYGKIDKFAHFYNTYYKASILGQGSIGNITFYTDHHIKEDKIAFYFKQEEFVFDFDMKLMKEKGMDTYLGHFLKTIEVEYLDRVDRQKVQKENNIEKVGDHTKIFKNPGNVSYEDLKAYLENQRLERMKPKI